MEDEDKIEQDLIQQDATDEFLQSLYGNAESDDWLFEEEFE
jgi:hypothetical protein